QVRGGNGGTLDRVEAAVGPQLGQHAAVLRKALRRAVRPQQQVFASSERGPDGDPRLAVVGLLGVGGWDGARVPRHRVTLSAEVFRTIRVSMPHQSTRLGTLISSVRRDLGPERAIGFEPTTSSLGIPT